MRDINQMLGAIKPISHYATGEASFSALRQAVDGFTRGAPADHDVLITAYGLTVSLVRYVEPHTFLFSGIDEAGHESLVAVHFSQLLARVIYLPKRGPERVVVGFAQR